MDGGWSFFTEYAAADVGRRESNNGKAYGAN